MKRGNHRPLLAAVLAGVLLFSGCTTQRTTGEGGTGTGTPATTPTAGAGDATDPTKPDPDKKYTITWVTYQLAPLDENAKMIQYWNEQFNVDLQVWNIDNSNSEEILSLKFASGEIPDVLRIGSVSQFQKFSDQQILAKIPEGMAETYMPNVITQLEKELPGILRYGMLNGETYAIPAEVRTHNLFRAPIVYRGDWMENVGVTKTPETLDELETLLYKFAKEDPDGNGKADTYGLSQTALNAVYGAFGYVRGQWNDKDGKLSYSSTQPEMKQALAVLNKWYKDGVLDPEFITGENKGGYWALSHSFIEGRIGMSSMGSYYHWSPLNLEAEKGANPKEMAATNPGMENELVFGLPPTGPDGKSGMPKGNLFSGVMLAFGSHMEQEPDKMAKVMEIHEYLSGTSEKNYFTAWFGIEGEDWNYSPSGIPVAREGLEPQQMSAMGAHGVLKIFATMQYDSLLDKARYNWGKENKFDVGGLESKLVGTLPSAGIYGTETGKIEDEAFIGIITGDKPLDYFDEFVKQWGAAGGDVLTKEANEWYENFK